MRRSRTLELAGISVPVPSGWEGRGNPGSRRDAGSRAVGYPYVHLATVPVEPSGAAYGGGTVEKLGATDCFLALVEFTPTSAGTALFAANGIPRRLRRRDFASASLQRHLRDQLGCQRFFTEGRRALCLYVVAGATSALRSRLEELNGVLAATTIDGAAR